MPRRQRGGRKSKTKEAKPAEPSFSQEQIISPVAKRVAEKIARGGVNYLRSNAERILIDSLALADEPEFADLLFDSSKTAKTTERFMKKYEQRLEAAKKKGKEAHHLVFDEMRIEVIAELATPAFRKEVFHRLERMIERLMATSDARKLETAYILRPMLSMKEIPWGLCGLIIAIYNRTIERTMREFQEEDEILGDLGDIGDIMGEFGQEHDPVELLDMVKDPQRVEAFSKKLEKKPGLRQRLERKIDEMADRFEEALWKGEVDLEVFAVEELSLPASRLHQELEAGQVELSKANAKKAAERYIEITRECLLEIMTPDRLQRLKADLEKIFQTWLRKRNQWAMPLQAEIGWLDDIEVAENRFLMAAYFGSIRRMMDAVASKKYRTEKPAPAKSRGLITRARGLFRKDK